MKPVTVFMKCHCLKLFCVICKGGALAFPFKHIMQASRIHHLTFTGIPKGLFLSPYVVSQLPTSYEGHYSTSGDSNDSNGTEKPKAALLAHNHSSEPHKHVIPKHEHPSMPPAPTTCCMSGCQNCVWLKYAEELKNMYHCSSDENKQMILSQVTDPNMRAFLELELTFMTNDCRYRPRSDEDHE